MIQALVNKFSCQKLSSTAAVTTGLIGPILLGLLNVSPVTAQPQRSSNTSSSFETASIKLNKSGRQIVEFNVEPGGRFVAVGVTMGLLFQTAYGVKEFQISKAPAWFDDERYDIDARPEESVATSLSNAPSRQASRQVMLMVQSLLTQRCKLVLGHETKELPIYTLVIGKDGPKLQPSTFLPQEKLESRLPMGKDGVLPRGGIWAHGRGNITSTGATMSNLSDWLSRFVGRRVVDRTGLSGLYDFILQWTPAEGETGALPRSYQDSENAPSPEAPGPSLFSALQQQLGLKLEAQKAPVDVLVIEHIEKPSAN